MMTFEKLHEGIQYDCLSFDGVAENTTDYFVRLVWNNPPDDDDFRSYYEEGKQLKGSGHRNTCDHRGISMNKIDGSNEALIREVWTEEVKYKRRRPPIWCKFRFSPDAGKVWPRPTTAPYIGESHCNFFKCDDFSLTRLVIVETVALR